MTDIRLSFVIPARNEEALIGEVLDAILRSVARASGVTRSDLWLPDTSFEVIDQQGESTDSHSSASSRTSRALRSVSRPASLATLVRSCGSVSRSYIS